MKKLLALLTALMLCAGCCAALAEGGHGKEDYLGCWKIEQMILKSDGTERNVTNDDGWVIFHEDDTVIISLSYGSYNGAVATYADGGCTLKNKTGPLPVVIGADGKLRMSVTAADGDILSMCCVRAASPALPGKIAAMTGQWEIEYIIYEGTTVHTKSDYLFTIYGDSYGLLQGGGSRLFLWMQMENGAVQGVDRSGDIAPLWIDEDGRLNVILSTNGVEGTLVMKRVGQPPAQAQTAEATATADDLTNQFLGKWVGLDVSMRGREYTIEELGWSSFGLRIEQDVAYLDLDGENGACPTKYEGDTLIFTSNDLAFYCRIEDGFMYMEMEMNGAPVIFRLKRVDGVPAAVHPGV